MLKLLFKFMLLLTTTMQMPTDMAMLLEESSRCFWQDARTSKMLPRWDLRRLKTRAAQSRRDCSSRGHSAAVRAECSMQQVISYAQSEGQLCEVAEEPVSHKWLLVETMPDQMRFNQWSSCVLNELEQPVRLSLESRILVRTRSPQMSFALRLGDERVADA